MVECYKEELKNRLIDNGLDKLFAMICPKYDFVFSQAFSELELNDKVIASSSLSTIMVFMRMVVKSPGIPVDRIGVALETNDSRNRIYATPSSATFTIGDDFIDKNALKPILDKEIRKVSVAKGQRQLQDIENDPQLDLEVKAHKKSSTEAFYLPFQGRTSLQ